MLLNEACLISDMIDEIQPASILDCGSGSRVDRNIIQPHIAATFAGHNVIWSDVRPIPNQIQCDYADGEALAEKVPTVDLVTALSLLEHVEDVEKTIDNLVRITSKHLMLSVPKHYPWHGCPIDNAFRPSAEELAAKLTARGMTVIRAVESPPEQFGNVSAACASIVLAKKE